MNFFFLLSLIFIINAKFIFAQNIIYADPFKILDIEKNTLEDSTFLSSLTIRPIFGNDNKWSLFTRSELYFNTNAPNYENMGNKFIGKGLGLFTSINLSYIGKNIIFSFEPYYFTSQNKEIKGINREGIFIKLNDVRDNFDSPYQSLGIRETQLYIHHNNIGIGY